MVDRPTFEALPDDLKRCYGGEEVIEGKRDERFQGRRCTLIEAPKSYGEVKRSLRPGPSSTIDAAVVPQLGEAGVRISDGPRKPLPMRWFVAAGLGVVTLAIGAVIAIFVSPALFSPPLSKALPGVTARQSAMTQAPAAVQPSQPEPTRTGPEPAPVGPVEQQTVTTPVDQQSVVSPSEQQPVVPLVSTNVQRFDGIWIVTLVCKSTSSGLPGWRHELVGRVRNGIFHTQLGPEGKPGSSHTME